MRKIRFFIFTILLLPLLVLPLLALSPFFQTGEKGKVVRVIDGDSIILENGLMVRLAQIDAPWILPSDNDGIKARAALSSLVLNKNVILKYGGLRRDRQGRALAQVFIDNGLLNEDLWVNITMLRLGYARVHTYSDNRTRIEDFWAAEREARREKRGIWDNPKYMVRFATPNALIGADNRFQLIEGKIIETYQYPKLVKICFGNNQETDVCALIPDKAWVFWPAGVSEILALKGHNIRIRGKVTNSQGARTTKSGKTFKAHGPQIWLDHPEQIEFLISK